eukprot:5663368-Prymnesium_polylepis.2
MSSPVEVLKKSCAKNGLATTGTKAELLARLLNAPADKKKPSKDDGAPKADVSEDDGFDAFMQSERASESAFFEREDDIKEEILRRRGTHATRSGRATKRGHQR